jgi:hypothetical protein
MSAGESSTLASSRLRRLAQRGATPEQPSEDVPEYEHCELCDAPIGPRHRHMLDLRSRDLQCACQACTLLFDRSAAGGGHFKLVPDRVLRLDGFELTDHAWESLRIPVDIAFFFRAGAEERVMAFYPSPMGPTECQLGLDAWAEIEAANPVLKIMADDVEGLLVDRAGDARRQWIVPIEECYGLVGLIRSRWKGLSGGKEVWAEIDAFFAALDHRAKAPRPAEMEPQANAGTTAPARGS